jgi:hypothetical protein
MTKISLLLLGTTVVVAATFGNTIARAAALGFTNAKAWHFSDRDCFFDGSYAAIWNTCNSDPNAKKVLLSATTISVGNHTFKASASDRGSGGGTLPLCRAIINAPNNAFINQTPQLTVAVGGTTLGTLNVSSPDYSHHFDCDIYPGRYGMSGAAW